MIVIILTIATWVGAVLLAGPAQAQTVGGGQTTIVPRTTITVDEQPMVVQPAPFGPAASTPTPTPTPSPEQRRRRDQQVQQQGQPPATPPAPAPARPQGPRRPTNGYSSFLTGPIDLTRPPVPQQ
jgi:hypothetical protein